MNKKRLRKQNQVLNDIRVQLESIINNPNRNILDDILVDYVLLQRDNVDIAIQQTMLIERLGDKELMKNREQENNNIIESIYLDNILSILNR